MLRSIFWNAEQNRLRALWRLLLFLLIVAFIANPLILLLDATDNRLLERSLENPIVAIGFFIALWISARYLDKRPLNDFGLALSELWWKELGVGFLIGGLMMSTLFFSLWMMGWLEIKGLCFSGIATPFVLVFLGQLARYVAGSFFEELMSRSYLLRSIAEGIRGKYFSRKHALLFSWGATSLIFGVLHLMNPEATFLGALNISLLGLLFGLGMVYTGRLALPIGLHMSWNIFQNNIFGLPNGGKPSLVTIIWTELTGPEWMTGGTFGPEGSFLSLVAIILGGILVWLWLGKIYKNPILQLNLSDPPKSVNNNTQK